MPSSAQTDVVVSTGVNRLALPYRTSGLFFLITHCIYFHTEYISPVCMTFPCRFSAAGHNSVRCRETDATVRSVSIQPGLGAILLHPKFDEYRIRDSVYHANWNHFMAASRCHHRHRLVGLRQTLTPPLRGADLGA